MKSLLNLLSIIALSVGPAVVVSAASAETFTLKASVQTDGKPVGSAEVSLWLAQPGEASTRLAEATTNKTGGVVIQDINEVEDGVFYLRSIGGLVEGVKIPHFETLAVLNPDQRSNIILNELTTIGSIWPVAGMFDMQNGLLGSTNGLLIGSSHVSNLVDVERGTFGHTVLNGTNLTKSETVGRMNTLAALSALCGAQQKRGLCADFLAIGDNSSTLDTLVQLAKRPFVKNDDFFNLFTKAYPFPKGEERRDTDFLPYLSYVPTDFALMVRLVGGGTYSPGRLMFDDRAQLWSGQNWMPGSQSGLEKAIGGGVTRLDASGRALSPPLTGYNDQGLDGIGWGTTVSSDKVWVGTFNKKIGVFDLDGKALGPAQVNGEIGGIQGLATAPNGDVWACDNQLNQMIRFPGGDHTKGEIIKLDGLNRPFAVAVDNDNFVWVSNNGGMTVTRFNGNTPEKVSQISVGTAPRGIGIDSKGNVWVGANMSPGYPVPKIPAGASIIDEFRISLANMKKNEKKYPNGSGNLTMLSSKGDVLKANLLNGQISAGWGVSIDGQDTVFIGNFFGTGFMQVCGQDQKVCPDGVGTGQLIHAYKSGVLEKTTDIMVDDAGNVWNANNWNVVSALVEDNPNRVTATMGGGDGIVVIYGIAKPVTNPLIGAVRSPG